MWVCVHECQVPVELELQATVNHLMWALRTTLRSSAGDCRLPLKHLAVHTPEAQPSSYFPFGTGSYPDLTWNSLHNPSRPDLTILLPQSPH